MIHSQTKIPPRTLFVAAIVAALGMSFSATSVQAQGGQTGQGGTGTGGTGQTGNFGQNNTSSGSGSTTVGTGGVNAGGVGGDSTGQPNFLTFGETVDTTGGTGFAGRGDITQNFVGGTLQGQGGAAGAGNRNMFSALNRGQGQLQRPTQPTGPSRSERVRPRHRIAFEYTPKQNASIGQSLRTRLGKLPVPLSGVDVTLDASGTATIRGTARSEDSLKLAAALVRLEPGVRKVDNQLTVAGSN